ncbi:tRNA selenocysteine 1-associated protein 1 isoform X2 [Ixodes scapularis]
MSRGTLWMGDIEPYMDDAFLKQAFAQMGEACLSTKIIANKLTGLPVGYGFMEFLDEATAQRILLECDGKPIPGSNPVKKFKLNRASHSKEANQQREFSAFVGNLSSEVDDLSLYTAFHSRFSSVKAAKVVLDDGGQSRGYGFVRFGSEEQLQDTLCLLHDTEAVGTKPIRVGAATPKRALNSGSMATPPGQQQQQGYQQQYYGGYGYNYPGYYNPWQGYQQYYGNYQGYPGYAGYYGQQEYAQPPDAQAVGYDYAAAGVAGPTLEAPAAQPQQPGVAGPDPDNDVEDHDMSLPDVDALNKALMARSEDLYSALDSCRWLPTDGLDPPLVPVK